MSAQTILTLANGHGIDLLDPQPRDIDFAVVAEQLAKEKRYNGATPGVEYSVAQHCVLGADAIVTATGDRLLAAYFLLHDAHEHVLKDDTTPKKRALDELAQQQFGILAGQILDCFKQLESRQDVAVHAAAGLPWPPERADIVAGVKRWDLRMFVTEWRDLMRGIPHPDWKPYEGIEPALLNEVITPWPWRHAAGHFVLRCGELLPALGGGA